MAQLRTTRFILGDQSTRVTLESTYTGNSSIGVSGAVPIMNAVQAFFEVEYTMGTAETANSIEMKLEFADFSAPTSRKRQLTPASTDWYQEVTETVSGGTVTVVKAERTYAAISAAATYDRITIPVPLGHDFVRISLKETGVASNKGNASVKLVLVEEESIN